MRILIVFLMLLPASLRSFGFYRADTTVIRVPLGGNGWLSAQSKATLTPEGVNNWHNVTDTIAVWLRTEAAGTLDIAVRLKVAAGTSTIKAIVNESILQQQVQNTAYALIPFGTITISQPGYTCIRLAGVARTGSVYADISDLCIKGSALQKGASYVANNEGNYYYWGHRGPSVHLNYPVDKTYENKVEWFYNEIQVPEGYDPEGSYFMANGFKGGYFGMQVNSATERRVLFSVWSPFVSDDPKSIPDSLRIRLLKKGNDVHTGEFGNEGAGGQSYLRYNWKAGNRYAFLLHALPDTLHKTTTFTAYFKDLAAGDWQLIASFVRPQSGFGIQRLHSFAENFNPQMGNVERKAFYTNQWIKDEEGNWHELTKALFTGDATANKNYRKDYGGGTQQAFFYLRNGGFFSDFTTLKTPLERVSAGSHPPDIDIAHLP